MRDYTYIDTASDKIMLVCLSVKDLIEADYQFKDVIGRWPWTFMFVHVTSEPTCLKDHDDMYILEA
jgi:hypothetical protein